MRFVCSLVVFLALAMASDHSRAGVLNWLDDGLKAGKRAIGRLTCSGAMSVSEEVVEKAVARYGDDAAVFLEKTGTRGVAALDHYGGDVLAWYREGGEKALVVMERPRFADEVLPLARRHGPDVFAVESKVPGVAGNLFRSYGNEAGRYVRNLSSENAIRMAEVGPRLQSMGKAQRFGELASRSGDRLFEIIEKVLAIMNRNPKASGMALTFLYCLTHPSTMDEFLKALADIPGEIARELFGVFGASPDRFPVQSTTLTLGISLSILLAVYLHHRRKLPRIRAKMTNQN